MKAGEGGESRWQRGSRFRDLAAHGACVVSAAARWRGGDTFLKQLLTAKGCTPILIRARG